MSKVLSGTWAVVLVVVLTTQAWMAQSHRLPDKALYRLIKMASNFGVINHYGPFAVMTKKRNELIIEGSQDGEHWLEYGFKYKPDGLNKPLSWNIPHQPRLDWQLWFAALSPPHQVGWFDMFMRRLQEGSPEVLALLAYNPFPSKPPPYLRASLYRYTFATYGQRMDTGQIWNRKWLQDYWPY